MRFEVEAIVSTPEWVVELGEEPQDVVDRIAVVLTESVPARHGSAGILFASDDEVQALNRQYRGKDAPTNVLAFPAPEVFLALGDVALALETIRREASEQNKTCAAHATHMIVHGLLHLVGHTHDEQTEAEAMEALERRVLEKLGIADPYVQNEGKEP